MATDPRKPFQPMPLPTPPGSQPASAPKEAAKGGTALPLWTAGSSDKLAGMPLFRGAGQKSNSVMGRLKSLKTKDMAFIGAGLAVLVMAPLAEYLISEGEDPNKTLTQGFAQNGMQFPGVGDPSEPGIMGLARGGVPGDASDVITPLNARDPSSLIMGGNGEQKEAPPAAAAEPKRDAPKDSVWDKVVSSAKSGVSAAARKVSLPKPGGKLAGAINGLRSLSGGSTGASLKLSAPDAKGLFSAPKNESHLAATQPVPGYRGAGPRVIAGGSGGNLSGRNGGGFGGPGGAMAGDVMSGGISGGGKGSGFSGGDGDPTKNPGGNSTKDSKTLGESLAFLRQKMEMEKAIDLKWAKKRYDELERKKMIEQTLVQTAQQAFMKVLDKLLEGKKDAGGGSGGGSGGGGSPGGGGAPTGKDQTGAPAATPAGNLGSGTAIAKGDKAVPAYKAADASKGSVTSAKTDHDTARTNLGNRLAAFKEGTNGPDVDAAVKQIQTAQGSQLTASGLAAPLKVAESKVNDFKTKIDAEKQRMEAEEKLATDAVIALGGHATSGSGDTEAYEDPASKVAKRKGDAPKGEQPPAAYEPGNALKAADEVIKRAQDNLKVVADAQGALQTLSALPQMPATAKPTLAAIGQDLSNMKSAAETAIKGAQGYKDNLNAIKEYTQKASNDLKALIPKNDAVQTDITSALEKGEAVSSGWIGLVKKNEKPKKDKPTAESALSAAAKKATEGKTAAEKIKTGSIE